MWVGIVQGVEEVAEEREVHQLAAMARRRTNK
eukprot:CAMPEP_0183348814 /NCGR_PEP_ID=MMETSP0164_2-20130417/13210_1 /TAXON_ID=221442 /ORGANISM="Coccolithus pelagicus ssp braarudi, Strain PLY182g" /LENGTH=31 /DNA_ID= /DNA_START= /DNA_END= /DNA_ORIENTATION=